MDDTFALEILNRYTPTAGDAVLDWADVLGRAEIAVTPANGRSLSTPNRPLASGRSRRRVSLALVVLGAAFVVAVATPAGGAIARTLGDFSAWVTGLPGKQAPAADQRAFSRATRSWFAFPAGTKLHRLLQTKVDGVTVALDGYRVGDSLCLRVVATGAAKGSGESCAPLSDLKAQREPALVVLADSGFGMVGGKHVRIGPDVYTHSVRVDVTIGIVADGITKVETAGSDKPTPALIGNDAFLAIVDRPPVGYRTKTVWATAAGKRVAIPLAQAPFGELNSTAASNRKALGPSKAQRKVTGGEINWLDRRESRGQPVPSTGVFKRLKSHPFLQRVLFQRLLTPDPNSLLKEVITVGLTKTPSGSKTVESVCNDIVNANHAGGGCDPIGSLFAQGPLGEVGQELDEGGDQYEILGGLASDTVKRIELFLATGERIAVPLNDNAFVIQVERSSFPARFVAYDREGLVIDVETFLTDAGSTGPATVAPTSKWRTIIKATSPTGKTARVRIAPKIGGGTCWAIRITPNGGGEGGCFPKKWKGPALNLGYSELDNAKPRPSFVEGQVRPGITTVVVHLHDRRVLNLKVTDGLVVAALPAKYRLAGGEYVIGFDATGKPVARETLRI